MPASVLDTSVALADLLDVEGIREVCRSFGELYGIGIRIFDADASKVADVRASTGDHCGYLFSVHPTQVLCTQLVNQIRTCELSSDTGPRAFECFSGLRYRVVPLLYEGTLLGRLIFGPYAPADLTAPPEGLRRYEPDLDLARLGGYLARIPRAAESVVDRVVAHLTRVFEVIVHSSYRTYLTSRLHIESITTAFRDAETANRSLKQANDRLKDLDRLKSNFIATVSHELRTPLTSVIGYSEMLLENMAGELTHEQRDYVQTILEKGESLLSMIGQVLDMSRIESGNVVMRRESCDPREIIQIAVSDVTPQAQRRSIEISTEVADDVAPIVADRDKIRRVLTNLLSNAVKFTPERGQVRVAADVQQVQPEEGARFDIFEPERNRRLRLRVTDSGIGIPPDKLDDIFDAFYQVDNSSTREFGGTGLGLSIVRNFVRAHGGQVAVESQLGAGTTFTVLLPYLADELGRDGNLELRSRSA